MDSFKDEVYEQMDEISKLVEPFEYSVNNDLAQFPDEFEIPISILNSSIGQSTREAWIYLGVSTLVRTKISEIGGMRALSNESFNTAFIEEMFAIEVRENSEEEEIVYNAQTGEITGGKLFVVKRKIAIEDKEIEAKMITYLNDRFVREFSSAKDVQKKALNDIAELFGATKARKERAWRKKVIYLSNHFEQLLKSRSLVIKDFELFKRFISWNIAHIKDGNLPAMQNIATLKVMSRNNQPIYSMKEVGI